MNNCCSLVGSKQWLICALLIFLAFNASAQESPTESLQELISRLGKSQPDTGRISLELKLGSYYLYKPGEYKDDLDSTIHYLNQALQLSGKLHEPGWQYRTLALIGNYYAEAGDPERSKAYFMRVIAYEHQKNDNIKEADIWYWLADLFSNSSKEDQGRKLDFYQHAYALYLQSHQQLKAAKTLRGMAEVHLQNKQFDLAESELYSIIKDPNNAGKPIILTTNNALTGLYIQKGEYNKALPSALKTVGMMQATGDSAMAAIYYMQLTSIYHHLGKPSLCLEWAKKGFNHAVAVKAYNDMFYFEGWIATELIAEGKVRKALQFTLSETARYKPVRPVDKMFVEQTLGRCYAALKEFDLAEKYYLEMIRVDQEVNRGLSIGERVGNYSLIGNFYLNIKKYKEAEQYLNQALSFGERYGVLSNLQYIHRSLFKADSALGNYKPAINHLLLSNKLKDSIFTVAKNKQVEELQIKYETAENKRALDQAQNKARLEQIDLQHAQNTRNWIIAGSGLLLIIAGLLYRQNRLKQKNGRIVSQKNKLLQNLVGEKEKSNTIISQKNDLLERLLAEKELLLKEVHHRVKNNLYIVMSLLESQSSFLKDNAAVTAILESQSRVRAIALIHQKLYGSANFLQVAMQSYIPELLGWLADSFNISRRKIVILHDIDPVDLDVSQAIPIGIILNETITNAIKYAFLPKGGTIRVIMKQTDESNIHLTVEDTGTGFSKDIDPQNHQSLGLSLIQGLSIQLQGRLSIVANNGVSISIDFAKDENVHFNGDEFVLEKLE